MRFLMCDPRYFEVCYVINPWMEGNLGKVNRGLARQQWKNLHDILGKLADITLIEPVKGLPDMVFTANAGLVYQKEDGNNYVIIPSFLNEERHPEVRIFEQFFLQRGYKLLHLNQDMIFEGAGDALFDSQGRLWLGSGIRSSREAKVQIIELLQVKAFGLELVDSHWYHLDTAFCPLSNGQILAYQNAFSKPSVKLINETFGKNIIWISELDAKNFACNAIAFDHYIIMHFASKELKATLRQSGFEVLTVDVSEFIKAGGACKCLVLEI